jgi:hypothetical protein
MAVQVLDDGEEARGTLQCDVKKKKIEKRADTYSQFIRRGKYTYSADKLKLDCHDAMCKQVRHGPCASLHLSYSPY